MPKVIEAEDLEGIKVVPRSEYIEYYKKNPGLQLMPKEFRQDLSPLQ